ncbi:Uncharacterised protein [Bordetella trematum]|nr:Uncharacterised protein [Bordetella trematum]
MSFYPALVWRRALLPVLGVSGGDAGCPRVDAERGVYPAWQRGGLERFCYTEAAAWADCLRGRFGLDLPAQEAASLFDRALRRSQAAGASTLDGSPGAARLRAADTTSCRSG